MKNKISLKKYVKNLRGENKKVFFISPVRLADPEIVKFCENYVKKLRGEGIKVHWPIKDTDQNDPIGIKICDTNLGKIFEADEIHVYYLPDSTGIHFDLGAAYILKFFGDCKKIIFLNKNKNEFEEKFIGDWSKLKELFETDEIRVRYSKEDMILHFLLGAAYMLIRILEYEKKVVFTNKDEFDPKEISLDPQIYTQLPISKSFLRVLNFLDENTGAKR